MGWIIFTAMTYVTLTLLRKPWEFGTRTHEHGTQDETNDLDAVLRSSRKVIPNYSDRLAGLGIRQKR
jgi:hypothetical protein